MIASLHHPGHTLAAVQATSDDLAVGTSQIGAHPSQRLMTEAWDRLARE